jgi:hypothetical protein
MQQLIDLIKADIAATVIAFLGLTTALLGLLMNFSQAKSQQQRQYLEGLRIREAEIEETVKQRQYIQQQLKLQGQQIKFQEEQITQILDWVSKITFNNRPTN